MLVTKALIGRNVVGVFFCQDLSTVAFRFKDKERPRGYTSKVTGLLHVGVSRERLERLSPWLQMLFSSAAVTGCCFVFCQKVTANVYFKLAGFGLAPCSRAVDHV